MLLRMYGNICFFKLQLLTKKCKISVNYFISWNSNIFEFHVMR